MGSNFVVSEFDGGRPISENLPAPNEKTLDDGIDGPTLTTYQQGAVDTHATGMGPRIHQGHTCRRMQTPTRLTERFGPSEPERAIGLLEPLRRPGIRNHLIGAVGPDADLANSDPPSHPRLVIPIESDQGRVIDHDRILLVGPKPPIGDVGTPELFCDMSSGLGGRRTTHQ